MKVPYNWIKDYVDIDVTPQELGDMLTLTGSQLEEVITQGDIIKKVVVCQIEKIEKVTTGTEGKNSGENKFKLTKNEIQNSNITETQNNIIGLMLDSPTITQETLARLLDVNIRTIQRNIKILMDMGLVERTGATKKGKWIVKKIV